MNSRVHLLFGIFATVAVAATVGWGFVVVGSPDTRRQERLDERRLEHLQQIHSEILLLVVDPSDDDALERSLPRTLEEVAMFARDELILEDPDTGDWYGYEAIGDTTYVLSAIFDLPRDADYDVFWNHPAGRHSFTIDALDPP